MGQPLQAPGNRGFVGATGRNYSPLERGGSRLFYRRETECGL